MRPVIGNASPWGEQGYTVLEVGELEQASMTLRISHYLVCNPAGEALPEEYATLEAARAAIESLESTS